MSGTDRPCLVFVQSFSAPEGFRSGEGTDDEIVVRELVQNALDAGANTVDFSTVRIPVEQVPDIDGYRAAVEAIHPNLRQTPVARASLERIDRALNAQTITCLLCTDNGNGLRLDEYHRLLAEAMSAKVGEASVGKLGSVGVGHLTALDASDMRYVLYASQGGDGLLFGGQVMLASQLHERDGEEVHRVRQGCLTAAAAADGFVGFNASPADPASTPDWLTIPRTQGTTVAILAHSSRDAEAPAQEGDGDLLSDPHLDRVFEAVAKHFMVALKQGRLRVTFSSESRTKIELDDEEIRRRLEANRGNRYANRRGYGSGARAWAAWETLTDGEKLPCDGGSLWYLPTPGKTPTVVVFRNGMRITDQAPRLKSHDFRGIKAFSAVLDADGDLAAAIKECETDSHLEIKVSQAPGDFGKLTQQGLQDVQDALKEAAGELETDEWVPDVLRIFDAEDMPNNVEPAPPRHRPPHPDSPQPPLPQPDPEPGPAPPGPSPGPGPGPGPGPEPGQRHVEPRAWRPGSVQGVRRSFIPVNGTEAVVEWDFTGEIRRPTGIGLAIVVGSGSQPSDRRPAPDRALQIRPAGADADEWTEELRVPASQGTIRVEVRGAPPGWEAVTAVVSRRA